MYMSDSGRDIVFDIFEKVLSRYSIFKNRDALRPDYIPDNLPHRSEQIQRLAFILAPSLKGSLPSNVFLYGKPGTGKTAVTQFVLSRLKMKAKEAGSTLAISYINCRIAGTEYRVLASLCSSIDVDVPFTGLSKAEVFQRFRSGLERFGGILIVVLDEIDALVKIHGDDILYELTRIKESSSGRGGVSMIGVSNDLQFKEFLDPRVLSSLSEEEILFRPYTADELYDILKERAEIAFNENVLSESALRLCAALAAAEHGDARRALDLLRVAGEIAERSNSQSVTDEHVRRAQEKIESDRVWEAIKTLPLHSRMILLAVYVNLKRNESKCFTGEVYEVYKELCEGLGLEPLTQRRISGLINELDAMGLLNSKLVSMGRYGRSKRVRLNIPASMILQLLKSDPYLSSLEGYVEKYWSKG